MCATQVMKDAMHMVSIVDSISLFNKFAAHNLSACKAHSDCSDDLECGEDEECVDPPCPDCAANAHCEASNHIGICTCNSGYEDCNPYGK